MSNQTTYFGISETKTNSYSLQTQINFLNSFNFKFQNKYNRMFELSNLQRTYFGLEHVSDSWERVLFKGDKYRPDSILYFEGNTIKKQVVSADFEYKELQYDVQTDKREFVLPKTKKGKPKKLTPSVLETQTPIGVYLRIFNDTGLKIGNHTSQTTFYESSWERKKADSGFENLIQDFIDNSPKDHLSQIEEFRNAKRKNIKFKAGDFFTFKLNRTEFGFGRILIDIHKVRTKKLLPKHHGLLKRMAKPVLIKLYAYKSDSKEVDLDVLKRQKSLPSDYIMDNLLFYGEYEIIGNQKLERDEFEFPISYGLRIDGTPNTYLHWGLIHLELPDKVFGMYLKSTDENPNRVFDPTDLNPYSYGGIGFSPKWDSIEILETISNNGDFDYEKSIGYHANRDLRNPKNDSIRAHVFKAFGLNPAKNYLENCKLTGAKDILDLIEEMK